MQTLKPGKQRKMLYQAPDHKRHKHFGAHLSPELQASQKVKTLPVRSGDTVRVVRGDHKGFEGKVSRIDSNKYRLYIDGLTREKVDGSSIFVPVHPSKIVIKSLVLDDKWRKKIIERKRATPKKVEKAAEKPKREPVEIKREITEEKVKTEKAKEKKPSGRKKRALRKPKAADTKEKAVTKKEEKPKEKKARTKRKSAKKSEGGA
ncbi:50S ribosomal protein L24 [Candidatus Bathyarchaeota archaeon RBG_13_46_16b]|nr:large subunit ribosomal protein L24 [uncultured archaeon]OGD47137.1 MAG: 50S ribosomal protein L24 [Candidatus Bathyarchaeota archaeon RBG_13_46_16b]